jgi:hypothetical protein
MIFHLHIINAFLIGLVKISAQSLVTISTLPTKSWTMEQDILDFDGPAFLGNLRKLRSAADFLGKALGKDLIPSELTFPDFDREIAASIPFARGKRLVQFVPGIMGFSRRLATPRA